MKYKLVLNHVIQLAVNKHLFEETKFTYLSVTSMCSQCIAAVNSKLGRTKDKESSCLWKQLLFHSDSFVARKINVEQKVAENGDPYCTELAVTHNTVVIKKQAENGNFTGCVFTDLSKAFDTLSQAGLL